MTDSFDDDTQFWDEPEWTRTGQVARVRPSRDRTGSFERTRTHRVARRADPPPTQAMTFDDFAPADDDAWSGVVHWVEPEDHRTPVLAGVDPRLVRIGGVALIGVLMIPLALALRDDPDDGLRSEAPAEIATTVAPEGLAAPTTTVFTVPVTAAVTVRATAGTAAATAPAPAPQALAAAAPEEPECAGTYVVIANDFWNRFPKSSGASAQEWLAANDATADTPLYVGDELCIPAGAQAPAPPTTAAPTTAAPTTAAAPPTTQPPATTAAPVETSPPATVAPPPVTAAPAPPAAPADPASVEGMIREVWPDELEERALTIARRESGLRPEAHNYCCYGIFAIYFEMGRSWLADLGITSAQQLLDARTNIEAAYHLYTLSGWQPWAQTDPG